MRWSLAVAAVMMFCGACAAAAEAPIAWEEQFDGPESLERASIYYEGRGSGKTGDEVIIQELAGGVYKYGLKYDPSRRQDRFNLMYGDVCWGKPKEGDLHRLPDDPKAWGPFDLAQYPLIETRWRGDMFHLWYGVETAAGKRETGYTFPPITRTESDAEGRPWNVSLFRLAPDICAPSPTTPVRLLGIDLAHSSPEGAQSRDLVTEVDWIRVRGFTQKEAAQEANVIETLSDFPRGQWSGLEDFFPFGVYTVGALHAYGESWGGDYEGAFGAYARRHFNYTPMSEVEIGRSGGDALATPQWPSAVDSFVSDMQPLIDAARATGVRLGADVRYMLRGREAADGHGPILAIARRAAEAFDDEIIVSWFVADEPKIDALLPIATVIRAIREGDPYSRPEVIALNSTRLAKAWARYLSVVCWDVYPVLAGRRDPWKIRLRAREYRRAAPEAPMWAILQSFETRPPTPEASYIRPSDAEIRMMAYLAIAEGAKGLIWYMGWNGYGRDEGLVDRTNLPRGGMMATLAELAERLIPIGRQLLAADPVEDAQIQVSGQEEPSDGHALVVSALKHRDRDVHFLVAVNEDLDHPRKATVTLPGAILGDGHGVYDLYTLDGKDLRKGQTFTESTLAGGDGRIYASCSEDDFKDLRTKILCARALEAVRVLTPDITIARRWGLALEKVDEAISGCRTSVDIGSAEQALTEATRARTLLFDAIDGDSELAAVRRALRDVQLELAEVSRITEFRSLNPQWWTDYHHPALVPNPGFLEQSKRYWQVGRSYRECCAMYLKGEREGLWTKLNETRLECLAMREDVLTFLRETLTPGQEPPPEK